MPWTASGGRRRIISTIPKTVSSFAIQNISNPAKQTESTSTGLCHVLQYMPTDYPTRGKYISLFQEMASRLKEIQLPDGSWRASLLDPGSFTAPESSGTAFFAYGFLWGINHGLLEESDYLAPATLAWDRLVKNVLPDGKLGFIQPIGENPKSVTKDMTAVYGVGGFLQVARELKTHLIRKSSKIATIQFRNPGDQLRLNETVSLPWEVVSAKLTSATAANFAIQDGLTGSFLPHQMVDLDSDGQTDEVLFTAHFSPGEARDFHLLATSDKKPSYRKAASLARLVPERQDDFVWENNRIAYRIFGPALGESEKAVGGIDVWTKSVRKAVANDWYSSGDYHTDSGTGLDGYKVGNSLGCGGLGYLTEDGTIHPAPVFASAKVLDAGPVQTRFELKFQPLTIGEISITETRIMSLDAGTNAFHVSSSFQVEGNAEKAKGIRPVAGVVKRYQEKWPSAKSSHFVGYWDPVMKKQKKGHIGTFIMNPSRGPGWYQENDQYFYFTLGENLDSSVSYYAGAYWSQPEGLTAASFATRLYQLSHTLRNPVELVK